MKRAPAKIVPKLLNFKQKQHRMDIAQERLAMVQRWSKKVIKGRISWLYGYDIEIKAQSFHFATIDEIKEKSKQELLVIPKSVFQKCFEDWKKKLG